MKKAKIVLFILLLMDLFFLVNYFINWGSQLNALWVAIFLIGIILSIITLRKPKEKLDVDILSIGVLVLSVSSIGGYIFNFYLTHFFG
ncbi:hypothetical protein [Bacillus norwichensis]|uniref:Uncharacterized protein n=1 Tax=Bacillus norwichensis TaxID=2762217 RepID=A0ABR8VN86_9BACI|nr:hypothetical protein [Bacillus norwichensis]MBD8006226.1 hypothetical protein [Bacillus norwichensis]